MDYKFELLQREVCHDGFFRLERWRLRHSQFAGGWGAPVDREVILKGHAAAVLLYDPGADSLVLVEQFRVGALEDPGGAWLLELVAGYIEPGESPEDVVHREAMEESGCEILDLIPIGHYLVSPGRSVETMTLFCGRVRAPESGGIHGLAEEGEDIRVHVVAVDEALERMRSGSIHSATPIIALQWLELHRADLAARWE